MAHSDGGSDTQRPQQEIERLRARLTATIQGKEEAIQLALVTLLAQGHLLLEDVPGVGKTTLALTLSTASGLSFSRIQFTSDLLPSDVLGVSALVPATGAFDFRPGPIFAQVVLADEINRTTPKTQSCLLEAMNEGHVSVDGRTHELPRPFMVIATQNPIEHHGTYPLPESQLDRFLMRIRIGYPDREAERRILRGIHRPSPGKEAAAVEPGRLLLLQTRATGVEVSLAVESYLLDVVKATRNHPRIELGVSPRGARDLYRAVQALAMIEGRTYAVPDDVKQLAVPVLAHRLKAAGAGGLPTSADEAEGLMEEILSTVTLSD